MDVAFLSPEKKVNKYCKNWCHSDINETVNSGSKKSIQGILYLWNSDRDDTSNTVLIPKSHKNEYYELLNNIPKKLYKGHQLYVKTIRNDDFRKEMYNKWEKNSRRIPVKKGSLLLFDSRTIHQGFSSGTRLAQTICYENKKYRNSDSYRSKLIACCKGIATTHWASLGIHHPVSFIKLKDSNLENIVNYSLKKELTEKDIEKINRMKNSEIEELIKPEILELL